jgi:signal peptidase complex subunit 1
LVIPQVIAFIAGYVYQDVYVTLWIGLAGTALTVLVVVPPWPIYNTHAEKWLSVGGRGMGTTGIVVDGVKVG